MLAGGFESGRSFPASQPPHPEFFYRPKAVSKSRPVWWCFRIHHSSDARISYLIRFPMNCPPSEDDFLFISSRFELLQSGVPERGVPLRIQPLLLAYLSLATLICLEQECDIAVTPCSPFGPGRALLPFPSQGRFQLQYPPSHGSLTAHYCVVNQPAQDCALKDFSADFSRLNCYATISFSRSLRSPYGFQCFPSTAIIARCLCC